MKRVMRISLEEWPIRGVFRISRGSSSSVNVEEEDDMIIGRALWTILTDKLVTEGDRWSTLSKIKQLITLIFSSTGSGSFMDE